MSKYNLAPITLFVYNRLDHTTQTIAALQMNEMSKDSDLIIYSDGPKPGSGESVKSLREYLKTVSGFKSIKIHESDKNNGLAKSIISGVTEVVNKYGKIIVLEDDIVTSPFFLKYMNSALDYYKDNKKVWNINSWTPPFKEMEKIEDDFTFSRLPLPWGWATWSDRWSFFEKDTDKIISEFSKNMIKEFNLGGNSPFWGQVLFNKTGKYSTWWVYWYAAVFKKKGFALMAKKTYSQNIGFDGSGENCADDERSIQISLNNSIITFHPSKIEENKLALKMLNKWFREKNIIIKIYNKLRKAFIK